MEKKWKLLPYHRACIGIIVGIKRVQEFLQGMQEVRCRIPMTYELGSPKPLSLDPKSWVLLPPSNSWRITIIWLYIALNRTPNSDCYCVGAVPNLNPTPLLACLQPFGGCNDDSKGGGSVPGLHISG